MLFTMKFGPFPIYVFAPMNTDPQETAVSRDLPRSDFNNVAKFSTVPPTSPDAIAENVRYVGALSRKLDSPPDIQKYCHGSLRFSDMALAFRISRAGIIVTKMPRNKAATSRMGLK